MNLRFKLSQKTEVVEHQLSLVYCINKYERYYYNVINSVKLFSELQLGNVQSIASKQRRNAKV